MTKRVAIYARHSTNKQNETSSQDQIDACSKYIEQQGWQLQGCYKDEAISGANAINRPGFLALTEASRNKEYDLVLVEDIDRLGRNVADVTKFNEILEHNKQELFTIYNGKVDAILLGVKATLDQAERKKIGEKTRRGMKANAIKGKVASGLAYGYYICEHSQSGRSINEEQAKIVNRIFEEYAAGITPENIAKSLNEDGIAGPGRNGKWLNTSIRGQGKRATGILNNELYIGSYVFNKTSFAKNPETAKREASINESDQHISVEIPELRIVSDELWNNVKTRQEEIKQRSNQDGVKSALSASRRSKYISSGLLRCSHCGGAYIMYGKNHMRCKNHKNGDSMCQNSQSFKRVNIEERILAVLKTELVTPELIKTFTDAYMEEMNRLQSEGDATPDKIQKQIEQAEKAIANLVQSLEEGNSSKYIFNKLAEREQEVEQLKDQLEAAQANDHYFSINNDLPGHFTSIVQDLHKHLEQDPIQRQAVDIIQSLITKIEVIPNKEAEDGVELTIEGDLAQILFLCNGASQMEKVEVKDSDNPKSTKLPASFLAESQVSVVAGARFELTTFRL
ncbi:recombinase family protein [Curvivirga sp.]|uniref:recombinase family protein n=1 Tax=Curvivirga sp. TaxID=2856848 RepID=UPI003B5BC61E